MSRDKKNPAAPLWACRRTRKPNGLGVDAREKSNLLASDATGVDKGTDEKRSLRTGILSSRSTLQDQRFVKMIENIVFTKRTSTSSLGLRDPAGSRLVHLAAAPGSRSSPPLRTLDRFLENSHQTTEGVRPHVGRGPLARHEVR